MRVQIELLRIVTLLGCRPLFRNGYSSKVPNPTLAARVQWNGMSVSGVQQGNLGFN